MRNQVIDSLLVLTIMRHTHHHGALLALLAQAEPQLAFLAA